VPHICFLFFAFFFFQAEDGIRDFHVTGVQTCALPIYANDGFLRNRVTCLVAAVTHDLPIPTMSVERIGLFTKINRFLGLPDKARSEERRVGKESRSRWTPYDGKKKKRVTTERQEDRAR